MEIRRISLSTAVLFICLPISNVSAFVPPSVSQSRWKEDLIQNFPLHMAREGKAKNDQFLDFMGKPVPNSVGDEPRPETVPIQEDPSSDLVRAIVKAADGRKAENIVALRVSPVSTLTNFMVILSGNSRPQNQAIAAAIRNDIMEEYNLRPIGNGVPEGSADSGWMLLDYGDVMVHIMTPKSRLYYNVEGQWREKGGMAMDISDVIVPNKVGGTMEGTMDIEQEEDDPFWS